MLARFLLVSAATLAICSAASREVYYQGPLDHLKTFDNGYLVLYRPGGFSLYGPNGLLRYEAALDVGDAISTYAGNVAVGREGLAVAAVHYFSPLGGNHVQDAGGLALFDAKGKQVRFVHTGLMFPRRLRSLRTALSMQLAISATRNGPNTRTTPF